MHAAERLRAILSNSPLKIKIDGEVQDTSAKTMERSPVALNINTKVIEHPVDTTGKEEKSSSPRRGVFERTVTKSKESNPSKTYLEHDQDKACNETFGKSRNSNISG